MFFREGGEKEAGGIGIEISWLQGIYFITDCGLLR